MKKTKRKGEIIMSRSASAKTWGVKQLLTMVENTTLTFSNLYQRSYVWDFERECELMATLIEGWTIPEVICSRKKVIENGKEKNVYDLLNGKQRLTAMKKLFADEVVFQNLRRLSLDEDDAALILSLTEEEAELLKLEEGEDGKMYFDINGLAFSQLPKVLRDLAIGRTIRVEYYDNLTVDEERRVIINANKAKGMTSIELTRVEMRSFAEVMEMAAHPIFKQALTEKAFKLYTNEDVAMKTWAVLYMPDASFETKVLRPYMRTALITKEQVECVLGVLDRIMAIAEMIMEDSTKIAKQRILGRTHISSMAPVIKRSIEENVPLEKMAAWLEYFYSGKKRASISDLYNDNATKNSAQKQSVRTRKDELLKSYEEFIVGSKEIPKVELKPAKPAARSKKPAVRAQKKDSVIRTVVSTEEDDNDGFESGQSMGDDNNMKEMTGETIRTAITTDNAADDDAAYGKEILLTEDEPKEVEDGIVVEDFEEPA